VEHLGTKTAARAKVAAWIENYNHHRRHSSCQMMPPVDYEKAPSGLTMSSFLPSPWMRQYSAETAEPGLCHSRTHADSRQRIH
jgi:hypothetical protein